MKKKYLVTITETTAHDVTIEADSPEQAEIRALEEHIDGHSTFVACTDRQTHVTPQ